MISNQRSQYLAEFIGTFFLVFFGCGAMVLAELNTNYSSEFIPVIFGGAVSIMIYSTGHISGAHFNPAVTLAFWSLGKFPAKRVFGYILFQCLGALLASFLHKVIFIEPHSFGKTVIGISVAPAFLIEFVLSFALMFVITSVATDSRAVGELAGIAIGSTVAICAFVGGPLTGASMNPARTLAPAILSLDFGHLWIYLISPVLGTVFGAKVYDWIRCNREEKTDESHGCC